MSEGIGERDVFDAQRWGLPAQAVDDLADRLHRFWSRFRHCFRTKTRDSGHHAWTYLRGLLTMAGKRNFANMARRVVGLHDDGQNLQQFISDSPWAEREIYDQIQAEITERPGLQDGMLTLDESGDERSGDQSAGAGRQYLGREGKVDMGQVGVALGYYKEGTWAMVDADLYLPKAWFDDSHARLRRRWHIPGDRTFADKRQLGLAMIKHAKANNLPFEVVGCDTLYGQDFQFRADLTTEHLLYMADIPSKIYVYLTQPILGIPERPPHRGGRPATHMQVLNAEPVQVRDLVSHPHWRLRPVAIRQAERGLLTYECAAQRVWTVKDDQVQEEWLFIRREADGKFTYSLSNAPADTPRERLAVWRSQRYFAERIYQDAKSEAGWDELVARKYRAWMHHTAMDALALWFAAETKLDWAQQHPRDPELARQLEVEVLPALSMANVRELLQASMPLQQLSQGEAIRLVTQHLFHRSRSTRSRLKTQQRNQGSA
jgi:SRSO17 transposase